MRIMINNINVADCEFRGYCNICKLKSENNCPTDCKDNPNCHYKRMMHTGAELNIHKTDKEHAYKRIAELQAELKAKEQECEELKENLEDLKKDLKFQNDKIGELEVDLQNAMDSYVGLDLMRVGEYNALVDDYNKLKQALTKIKEICEEEEDWCDYETGELTENAILAKLILEKISEVV